jgi:hypothetical protein
MKAKQKINGPSESWVVSWSVQRLDGFVEGGTLRKRKFFEKVRIGDKNGLPKSSILAWAT